MRSSQFLKRPSLRTVCTLLGPFGLLLTGCLISPAGAIHELQGGQAKTKTIQIPFTSHDGLEDLAKKAGKSRMHFYYFENLDHTLGILGYFVRRTLPEGHKAIFEFINKEVASRK